MKKTLFWLSEVNVLMWFAILGHSLASDSEPSFKIIAGFGLAIGAFIQHRAYYDIYKKRSDG